MDWPAFSLNLNPLEHVWDAMGRRLVAWFFLDEGENAKQAAEIVNGVYGAGTATAKYVQFWFSRFCSGIFDVKVAPHLSLKMSIKSQK
ncbi:hypothetical protein TNCV_4233781 [Trichonephila clavipes]|nr:hypothetical protein TNCV_4233781 [Trichonephila clavipes]